jgi:hypothetical protein
MTLAVSVATKPVERTKDLNMLICLSVVRSQTQEGPAMVADLAFGENPRHNAVLSNPLRPSIGGTQGVQAPKRAGPAHQLGVIAIVNADFQTDLPTMRFPSAPSSTVANRPALQTAVRTMTAAE